MGMPGLRSRSTASPSRSARCALLGAGSRPTDWWPCRAPGCRAVRSAPGCVRSLRRLVQTLRFAALSDTTLASFDLIAFVSTTNPARAEKFYADALGLQLVNRSPLALVFDAHGTMLRVTVVEQLDPAPNTVLGWSVADISEAIRALVARGVVFLRYESMRQDAQGIWQSPSGAMIAWFTDPDGNVLSLTQF